MKKILSLVAGIFLLLTTFLPAGAFAADNPTSQLRDSFKKDILNHTISKPINPLLEKKVTGTFNSNFKSNLKSQDTDTGTVYEQEPNDDPTSPNFNDNLPLGDVLLGYMDSSDTDFHKINVNNDGESIILTGFTEDYHTLGFLLLDSNLNIVTTSDEIYMDQDTGLLYEVMPKLTHGTYYAVSFDFTDPTDEYSYQYALYATTLASIPIVSTIKEGDSFVTGTADPGNTIFVQDGAQNVASGLVDPNGNFSVGITPQKTGAILSVKAYDPVSDSYSNSTTVTVVAPVDTTAPAAPKVNPIDDNDKTISGKAEANSKVTIKIGSKVFSVVSVDKSGNFKLGIKPFKAGTKLSFTATDKAGNVSKSITMTVADKTPPTLTVYKVYHTSHYVKGKTEAYATITIKNGKKTLASKKADSKGNFTLSIAKQKKGSVLTVYASDASHNTRSVKVKVY